jgi:hypothetical protein
MYLILTHSLAYLNGFQQQHCKSFELIILADATQLYLCATMQEYQQDLYFVRNAIGSCEDASLLISPVRTASYKVSRSTKSSD